jgi:hypothetical protein
MIMNRQTELTLNILPLNAVHAHHRLNLVDSGESISDNSFCVLNYSAEASLS